MRELIGSFDRQFIDLYFRSRELIQTTGDTQLYLRPDENATSMRASSVGEFVVRSAAAVEQMIGGITTRLWDDPFEWTLPERLRYTEDVLNYLDEVEATRQRGFAFFKNDDELRLTLPAPVEMRSLHEILLETLASAERLHGQAVALHQMIKPNE